MTLKIEMAALAATVMGAGAWVLSAEPLEPPQKEIPEAGFVQEDYAAFDREFVMAGSSCELGLADDGLCFSRSTLETSIVAGAPLPENALMMSAELRVLLATSLKPQPLKTVRVGHTLALVDPETRVVQDVLRLSAPTYAAAKPHVQTASTEAVISTS